MDKLFLLCMGPSIVRNYLCLMMQRTDFMSLVKLIYSMFSDQLDTIDKLSRTPNMFKQKYNGRYFM